MKEAYNNGSGGIWQEEARIRSYEADLSGNLTMEGMLKIFQEAAWNHAEQLGVGYSHLQTRSHVWVLVRMLIAVETFPEWRQSVKVRTWPRGIQSLLAFRDFEMLDMQGRRLAGATSGWMIIDLQSRRPQRLEAWLESIAKFPDRKATGADPEKIVPDGIADTSTFMDVKYSDLDLNDHVNNTTYVRWILDGYPVDFHRSHRISRMALNFLAELNAGDSVALSTQGIGALRILHKVTRQRDGVDACRADLVWIPKS